MALDRTWYNSLTDDDGSNLVGTLWNKAAVDSLMDAVDAEVLLYPKLPASTAPTTTGTQTAPAIPSPHGDPLLPLTNSPPRPRSHRRAARDQRGDRGWRRESDPGARLEGRRASGSRPSPCLGHRARQAKTLRDEWVDLACRGPGGGGVSDRA